MESIGYPVDLKIVPCNRTLSARTIFASEVTDRPMHWQPGESSIIDYCVCLRQACRSWPLFFNHVRLISASYPADLSATWAWQPITSVLLRCCQANWRLQYFLSDAKSFSYRFASSSLALARASCVYHMSLVHLWLVHLALCNTYPLVAHRSSLILPPSASASVRSPAPSPQRPTENFQLIARIASLSCSRSLNADLDTLSLPALLIECL